MASAYLKDAQRLGGPENRAWEFVELFSLSPSAATGCENRTKGASSVAGLA